MKQVHYETRVRRRRGQWEISVPALPRDAPRIRARKLSNAAPDLILELAAYLGTSASAVSVELEAPRRPKRRTLAERVTAVTWQLGGGFATLTGVYLAAGAAATLITAGVVTTAVAALKESGRI